MFEKLIKPKLNIAVNTTNQSLNSFDNNECILESNQQITLILFKKGKLIEYFITKFTIFSSQN